jgi:long-chain-fatty-acid--[acyl-carrier-protein] ligase
MVTTILSFFMRLLLRMRYSITINGIAHLNEQKKGTLILPNHPAYTEPIILFSLLSKNLAPRPLVYETYYQNSFIKPFMLLFNALEVPDMEKISLSAKQKAQEAIQNLVVGLQKGENFIIWPSGKLQRKGLESLGGNSGVSEILKISPNANVLLIRTTGLWGSRFSHAFSGNRPNLISELLYCALLLVLNLLFFMPKRKITITIEPLDTTKLAPFEKSKINLHLENWYNRDASTTPVYRPYHFLLFSQTKTFPPLELNENKTAPNIYPDLLKREVIQIIKEKFPEVIADETTDPNSELDSLGLDSIQRLELLIHLEQHFKFNGSTVPNTVDDLYLLCSGKSKTSTPIKTPKEWTESFRIKAESEILGTTVLDSFILRVMKSSNQIALIDDTSGMLTYRKLFLASLVISKILEKDSAKHVGILLPASAGGFIAYFACLIANKTPVLLNWTTGPANLQHAINFLGIKTILTSQRFIDRVGISIEDAQFIYLEQAKGKTGYPTLLNCMIKSYFPNGVLKKCKRTTKIDSIAAILFTSGSEKRPKAVPLTHNNLISNHKSGAPFLELTSQDTVLSFLPPFHSFGLSVTGILPILLGMRIVFHPDPTDASTLAAKLKAYGVTLLIGTPTFLTHILDKASNETLDELRLIISGAEKCPAAVFELAQKVAPNAKLLEGYGITECSPVVAVNPPNFQKRDSVGKPLPGVEVLILELETDRVLRKNETGMLHVSGPTIFNGYLGEEGTPPFKFINNQNWYITGDLVMQDDDGYLFFKGRLKRFIKVGGEMISLPALEEVFSALFPPDENGPMVAIEGIEKNNRKYVYLFNRNDMEVSEANRLLQEAGFRGIMRIDKVVKTNEIPVLGTGKTNYRNLREQIEKEIKGS